MKDTKVRGVRTSVGMMHPDYYAKLLEGVDRVDGKPIVPGTAAAIVAVPRGQDQVRGQAANASVIDDRQQFAPSEEVEKKPPLIPALYEFYDCPYWEVPIHLRSSVNHRGSIRRVVGIRNDAWKRIGRDTLSHYHRVLAPFVELLEADKAVRITITVIARVLPDRNNKSDYGKYAADVVAFCLGYDDNDSRLHFEFELEKRDAYGCGIRIEEFK